MSAELHAIELSHGKPRLTGPRLSDLGTAVTPREPSPDRAARGRFGIGNKAAARRGAKRALRRALAEARERIESALSEAAAAGVPSPELPEADRILDDAFTVHLATMAELGATSVLVQGQSLVHAVSSVLYGVTIRAAAVAGFLTEEGDALSARAERHATLAARAMTACIAATKALSGGRRSSKRTPIQEIEAAVARAELEAAAVEPEPSPPASPGPTESE